MLRGNLAPGRRGDQAGGRDRRSCCGTAAGRWCSTASRTCTPGIDDPDLDVDADSVLVLRGCGPRGYPGMPEVANLPLPAKLLAHGRAGHGAGLRRPDERHRVRHGRAARRAGGGGRRAAGAGADRRPDRARRAGPPAGLDVPRRGAGRARHRGAATAAAFAAPGRGWERLYVDHVLQADTGADLDFLVGASGDRVQPRVALTRCCIPARPISGPRGTPPRRAAPPRRGVSAGRGRSSGRSAACRAAAAPRSRAGCRPGRTGPGPRRGAASGVPAAAAGPVSWARAADAVVGKSARPVVRRPGARRSRAGPALRRGAVDGDGDEVAAQRPPAPPLRRAQPRSPRARPAGAIRAPVTTRTSRSTRPGGRGRGAGRSGRPSTAPDAGPVRAAVQHGGVRRRRCRRYPRPGSPCGRCTT